jgi:hypothetical protein
MMLVIAHGGHWLVNALYMAPIAVFGAIFGIQKLKERRAARATGRNERTRNRATPRR